MPHLCTFSSVSTKPSARIPSSLSPVFTYSDAMAAGLSAERLYRYRNEGYLEQLGRGLYRRTSASPADHNLLEIAHRVPEGTLCLITALARHGLTDVIPDRIDVAVPRGRRIPALQSPANVHVFAKDTFDLGRGMVKVGDGLTLGLYSAERRWSIWSGFAIAKGRRSRGRRCAAGFDERVLGRRH